MTIPINSDTVIVFDLDDTLYNELDYLKSAFYSIAQNLDPENHLSLYSCVFSIYRDKKDAFEYLSSNYNVSKDYLISLYRNHIPNIKPFDHVINTIHDIKKSEGNIGIITDGRKTTQLNKIKSLGIFNLIDKIVISEEIGTEKPSIQNYKAIENYFNKKEYYYIADNLKKDFITPKAIGWKTIGLIDNGLNIHIKNHEYFNDEHKPHHFIKTFKDFKLK